MFGKLMKVNMREVGMVMLPMYAALFILALAGGLTARFSVTRNAQELVTSTVPGVLLLILTIVYGILSLVMAVMTIVMVTRNFRDNLLGRRGYLMDTLPVTARSQVLSRVLNGSIWIALGDAASLLSGTAALLLVMDRADRENLQSYLSSFTDSYGRRISPWLILTQILVLTLLWNVQVVAKLYVSVSIGNLWRAHRTLGAVLAFVSISVLQAFIGNRLAHLSRDASVSYSILNNGVRFIFGFGGTESGVITARQMLFAVGQNGVYIVLFVILTIWVLKNRLDLQ